MRNRYTIAGETFPAKRAVKKRGQEILRKTPTGAFVSGEDFAFLKELFERYRETRGRKPLSITRIEVEPNTIGSWKGFRVHYEDGSSGDVSYINAASSLGGYDVHPAQVKQAMRQAIELQIVEFRYAEIRRGVDPDFAMTAEVDHLPPYEFAALVDGFLAEQGISFSSIWLEKIEGFRGSFLPEPWLSRFEDYHRKHALLELAAPQEHRKRTRIRKQMRNKLRSLGGEEKTA